MLGQGIWQTLIRQIEEGRAHSMKHVRRKYNEGGINKHIAVFASLFFVIVLAVIMLPSEVFAQPLPGPRHPPGTCTYDPQFDIPDALIASGTGIISTIFNDIRAVTQTISVYIFFNIASNESFRFVVFMSVVLYIMIYGIMFLFGMVRLTLYDFFIRMVKLGIIYWLLGGDIVGDVIGGGELINLLDLYVMLLSFFNDGTDFIITEITKIIVTGGTFYNFDSITPLGIVDDVIASSLSAKMLVTILATFFTGPYGVVFAILLVMSLSSLFKAVLAAIWVYIMGFVLRSLLIALSPIFISFILFQRTRPIFDGWLNQLVNASLQPIFLFIFFAFFVALIKVSLANILSTPVCWTEWSDSVRGTPFAVHFWRFNVLNSSGQWEPYGGEWDFNGAATASSPTFPLDVMHILIFFFLAQLVGRFNHIVIMIASDIAGASTNLASMDAPMGGFPGGRGGRHSGSGVDGISGYTGTDPALARRAIGSGLVRDGITGTLNRQIGSSLTGNR